MAASAIDISSDSLGLCVWITALLGFYSFLILIHTDENVFIAHFPATSFIFHTYAPSILLALEAWHLLVLHDHHPSFSSSSSDSSSSSNSFLVCDATDQAHLDLSTRDVPTRLCYPPRRALRRSEAFRRWCAAPLYTLYSQPIYIQSNHQEISIEVPLHILHLLDISDSVIEVWYDSMSAPIVEEEIVELWSGLLFDSSGTRDGIVRSLEDMPINLNDVVRDFYHHMSEVRIDRIVRIETVQRRLGADQLIARGQRVSFDRERLITDGLENPKGGVFIWFQELTMMCTKMVLEEEDRVEKFIGGIPDNIQGNAIAAEPTRYKKLFRIAKTIDGIKS
ncbi:hypothetical protein Tco_0563192 [Tanacetum coccineum]